jgi:hypothetical protein
MKKIGFIGIGKLGLDCAEVFAEHYEVRGYDIYPRNSDTVKVCDIDQLINHSEWIFIAVPTPHADGYDGATPSSHLCPQDFGHEAVIDAIKNKRVMGTSYDGDEPGGKGQRLIEPVCVGVSKAGNRVVRIPTIQRLQKSRKLKRYWKTTGKSKLRRTLMKRKISLKRRTSMGIK